MKELCRINIYTFKPIFYFQYTFVGLSREQNPIGKMTEELHSFSHRTMV